MRGEDTSVGGETDTKREKEKTEKVNIRDLVTEIMRTRHEPTPLAVFFEGVQELDKEKLRPTNKGDSILDSVIVEVSFFQRVKGWLEHKFPYGIEPYHPLRKDGEQAEKSLRDAVQRLKRLIKYEGPMTDVEFIVSSGREPRAIIELLKERWIGDKEELDSIVNRWLLGGEGGLFYPYNLVGAALELVGEAVSLSEEIQRAGQEGEYKEKIEKIKYLSSLQGLTFLAAVRMAYETTAWEDKVREILGRPWGDIFFRRIVPHIPDIIAVRRELGKKKTKEVTYADRWAVIERYLMRWGRELDVGERELGWSRKESREKRYEAAKEAVKILQAQSFGEGLQVIKDWLYPQLKEMRGVVSDIYELLESIPQGLSDEVITEEDKLGLVRDLVVLYYLLERVGYAPATRALLTILITRTLVEGGNFLRSESSINEDGGGSSQERLSQIL